MLKLWDKEEGRLFPKQFNKTSNRYWFTQAMLALVSSNFCSCITVWVSFVATSSVFRCYGKDGDLPWCSWQLLGPCQIKLLQDITCKLFRPRDALLFAVWDAGDALKPVGPMRWRLCQTQVCRQIVQELRTLHPTMASLTRGKAAFTMLL